MQSEKWELKEDWAEASIGDVTISKVPQMVPDKSSYFFYVDISSIDNDSKEIVNEKRIHGEQAPSRARQSIAGNDVLVSMTRPNLNAVALVPDLLNGAIASTGFDVLHAIEIEPKWLYLHVRSREFVNDMSDLVQGALYPAIKSRDVRNYKMPIPPLNEQKRIVAKIEQLQERSRRARKALESVPELLEQLRQSILVAAFRGDLTRKWREQNPDVEPASELLKRIRIERRKRWDKAELNKLKAKGLTGDKLDAKFAQQRKKYKEPAPVDTSDLPELPEGWCWANLSELKKYSIYGPRFSNDRYSASGTFVLRTTDIDDSGRVNIESAPRIKLTKNELRKYAIEVGDLLITRTGSIGTLAVFNDEVDAIPGAYLLHYRLVLNGDLSWFIFHQLKSPRCQHAMTGGSTGTGRPNLNAPNLEAISLALPPVEEQKIIQKTLNTKIEMIESAFERTTGLLALCSVLEESTLSKAFRGELVPQDPNDESASILLERIRQEKARQAAEKKAKPKKRGRKKQK